MGATWLTVTRVRSFGFTRLPTWTITEPVRPSMGERMVQKERSSRARSTAAWSARTVACVASAFALTLSYCCRVT